MGTKLADLAPVRRDVVLSIKDRNGEPVVVTIQPLRGVTVLRLLGVLPTMGLGTESDSEQIRQAVTVRSAEEMLDSAEQVVMAAAVEPRFTKGGAENSADLAILTDADLLKLMGEVLNLSGMVAAENETTNPAAQEAAATATFPVEQ